ncbi:Crp/Fnr family transcriptional regulator [Tepidicella baoligensis]|uniref:Crp/Fnr family transcriptional regulator n=1 Tax=Tepidicella baoligensis TaxID=2707016 RepID=UPI0015DA2574|nr:Crp/Fnr family transcriptional regulator [Tepidicella baoligensis]
MSSRFNSSSTYAEVARQSVLFHAQDSGPVWRLLKGCLRLDRVMGSQRQLVQLALPGDWLGLEMLTAGRYQLQAQALTDCVVEQTTVDVHDTHIWARAWAQQQQRHVHMTQLRTGKVAGRVEYLLELLDLSDAQTCSAGGHLPPLREIAEVVDATVETVCRTLSRRSARSCPAPSLKSTFSTPHLSRVWAQGHWVQPAAGMA